MFDTEGEFYTHESYEEGDVADEDEHDYQEDKSPSTVGVAKQHPTITEHKEKGIDHPLEFITHMPPLETILTERIGAPPALPLKRRKPAMFSRATWKCFKCLTGHHSSPW